MDHDRIDWNSFRFMVFDIPTSKGTYQERYNQLRTVFFPYAIVFSDIAVI